MAYQSWSVVFGEQPTAAKWNILGTNDASFNDGTGIGDGVVTPTKRSGGFYIGSIPGATLGSTGNKAITGVGFTPKLVRFTLITPASTAASIYAIGSMTVLGQYFNTGYATGTNTRRTGSTTNCIGWTDNTASQLLCSYVSMDADGFTINVGTASSTFAVSFEAYA